ncbi:MAG: hypothetical protein OXF41_22375 [bacterium]|nr:hypothetical protein [bacterium]
MGGSLYGLGQARYVVDCPSTGRYYRGGDEVLRDHLRLRPVRHWTEQRVRGHVAVCVYAAVAETLINHALAQADVRDPDVGAQHLTAARALRDLNRTRRHQLRTNGRRIGLTTRRSPLQARTLTAIGAVTRT